MSKKTRRFQNKGYSHTGASITKRALKGFDGKSGSPNEDINYNNDKLRQRSRVLMMSGGLALSAIKTNRTNIVGPGLYPKPRLDKDFLGMTTEEADIWQKKAEREFALWANNKRACDATGMNDFYSMQALALLASLASGDSFALFKRYKETKFFPYSLRLHIIEADRVSSPNGLSDGCPAITDGKAKGSENKIYDGVEINSDGLVVAYHIRNNYPRERNSSKTEWQRVEAFGKLTELPNIVQVMNSERPDQYRGVPYLAAVIEPILQTRRYTEAELMAAIVESFYTAFITTENADDIPFDEAIPDEVAEVSNDEDEYEMGPGTTIALKPGENVTFGDPKRPAGGFNNFIRAISVQIGAALEIPADLLLKEFNASYSASRAALLEAWKAFKMRRSWFVSDFCKPIYEVWMYEAIALGRISAPGFFEDPLIRQAYLGTSWIGPSQGMLDPTKEISAEVMACEYGLSTYSDSATRLNGSDWDANIERLLVETTKLTEAKVKNPEIDELIKEAIKEGVKTEEKDAGNNTTTKSES